MATEIATIPIRHGGEDGKVLEFKVGQTVEGLTDEQMADLRRAGAVEPKASGSGSSESEAQLRDKIAELETKLSAALNANATVVTPGNAAQTVQGQDNLDNGRTDQKTLDAVTKTNEKSEPAK